MKVKKLTETAIIPTRGSDGAAGYDLYADSVTGTGIQINNNEDGTSNVIVTAGSKAIVHTGIAMAIPKGYVGLIFARSGLACKQGLRPSNCVGVIDEDYRGEIIVNLYDDTNISNVLAKIADIFSKNFVEGTMDADNAINTLHNISTKFNDITWEESASFNIGDRVAQIVFVNYAIFDMEVVDELDETERGTGGFGSTGTK